VPVLTDAVRLRDLIEWIGSLDGKPKKPSFDKCSYLGKRVEGVAVVAVAEAHLVLFRSVDVGECDLPRGIRIVDLSLLGG